MSAARPCKTCGHSKRLHEHRTGICLVWPMPGRWQGCACEKYMPPGAIEETPETGGENG